MSQGEDAGNTCEKGDFVEEMELEKQKQTKAPKGALSPERAVALLYVLLALTCVLFMALTTVSLRRASAAWEALEEARMRSEKSHTTAWHNLSEVQHALDKQLSGELKVIHGQLQNVSEEVENVRWEMTQCKAECGKELSDRLRVLEEKDVMEPALRQLAEVKQEQSRALARLDAALEAVRNLSVICMICPADWQPFAKACYLFSTTTKPWLDARDYCASFNAHLAIVDTEQENEFLANHATENRVFWLGLTDMHNEGHWQWVDDRSLSLSFWNQGEPNNVGEQGENCAIVYSNGGWNDIGCSNPEAWICERNC
ncbi:C-type lectin domain family 4 member G-like isoform 2-T2 [Chlamydotis macqueenii]